MSAAAAVQTLLERVGWKTSIQPIVSIPHRSWLGLDATHASQSGVHYEMLSREAREQGLTLELGRHLRRTALESFRPAAERHPQLLLFLPFDPSTLDRGEGEFDHFMEDVSNASVPPGRVVIEVMESQNENGDALRAFGQRCRDLGFLLALSHLGSGFSTLSRLLLTQPDLAKISPWLLEDLGHDHARLQIVECLVGLLHKLGILCVAEGIRSEAEALAAAALKVDYVQGEILPFPGSDEALHTLANRYQSFVHGQSLAVQSRHNRCLAVLGRLKAVLAGPAESDIENQIAAFVAGTPSVDCGFLLDDRGIQMTESHLSPGRAARRNALVSPTPRGMDHSGQDYFYLLQEAYLDRYVTEPRMSHSTGRLCHTVSALVKVGASTRVAVVKVPVDYVEP